MNSPVLDRAFTLQGKHDATPESSWWTQADPTFYARAKAELTRMRQTRFASIQTWTPDDVKVDRRRRMPA